MTHEDQDKPVRDLISRVYLSLDLYPSDPDAIEAMLDAVGGQALTGEQVERMLKKAKGELLIGEREIEEPFWSEEALTEDQRELVALHRNGGEELPPDVKEKLRKLRDAARSLPKEQDDGDELGF